MTTFDYTRVREFADEINARLDRCDHGEGGRCATVENAVQLYAACCMDFYCRARQWAHDVFTGGVAYNSTTEQTWKMEIERLYVRALRVGDVVAQMRAPCYALDEDFRLPAAIWYLSRLRGQHWVTPRLSVAPSARKRLTAEAAEVARQRIAELAPLPQDWIPNNPDQHNRFQKIRSLQ